MAVGIFCHPEDSFALQLAGRLNSAAPGSCMVFDLSWREDPQFVLDDETVACRGMDLSRLDWLWVRGLPYMDPVLPPALRTADWSLWRHDHLLEQQRYSAWESLFAELERRGAKVINSRRLIARQFMLVEHLLLLQRQGFRVPELLCSNDMAEVEAFMERHPMVWWRPASGRAAWQRFTDKQRLFLIAPDKPPVMLAGHDGRRQLRAWLFGGECLLCLSVEPASLRPVEELEAGGDHGELARMESLETWLPFTPGERVMAELGRLAGAGSAWWIEVSFDVHAGGETVIFDVDFDPSLDALPPPVAERLLEALERQFSARTARDTVEPHALPPRLERPTLFLRRMLQIQFEMEHSKYAGADANQDKTKDDQDVADQAVKPGV